MRQDFCPAIRRAVGRALIGGGGGGRVYSYIRVMPKRLKCVMETEVQVHTMACHPNISQIMAVSIQKNHIYIFSHSVQKI